MSSVRRSAHVARAERRANRQLAFAPHRARENQVRDVRTRDDEDQRRRREQHEQDGPRGRRDLVAQLHRVDAEVAALRIRIRMLRDHRAVHRAQLRAHLLQRGVRRQPSEQLRHPVHAPILHRRRQMMRAGHQVRNDLRLRRIRHRRFEHADDHRGSIAEAHLLAEHRRIALHRRRPELVGEDDRARGVRAVVGGADQAAADGAEAHHVEVVAADDAGANDARLAEADQGEVERGEVAERRQALDARPQVVEFGDGEHRVLQLHAHRALADVDEAVLVLVDQRPQQHAADDAEHGGVGADAEREGDDDGEREPFDPGQGPERVAEIGEEAHECPITRPWDG